MEELRRPATRPRVRVVPSSGIIARDQDPTLFANPIVWAFDAFSTDFAELAKTARAISVSSPNSPIHPVYILSEEVFEDRGFTSFLKPALKSMAFKNMRAIIGGDAFESVRRHALLQTPRVLVESSSSLEACAQKLIRYSKRLGADVIAFGTHGRSNLTKFLTGSFADVLMGDGRMPLFISGPEQIVSYGTPEVIIFPTDFSPACKAAFPDVINLALSHGAELHLFHKSLHPLDSFVQTGVHMLGGGWVSIEAYFQQLPEDHVQDAETWLRLAQASGVTAQLVRENYRESTADSINAYAQTIGARSPLLAMVLQVGPVSGWLLGSVTRDVIRTSPYPVYLPPRITQA